MIIFIAGVFSGHILVKKIILSELYCVSCWCSCVICGQRPHYITGALKGRNDEFA